MGVDHVKTRNSAPLHVNVINGDLSDINLT